MRTLRRLFAIILLSTYVSSTGAIRADNEKGTSNGYEQLTSLCGVMLNNASHPVLLPTIEALEASRISEIFLSAYEERYDKNMGEAIALIQKETRKKLNVDLKTFRAMRDFCILEAQKHKSLRAVIQ